MSGFISALIRQRKEAKGAEPDTDMQAIFDNYISIGKVKNPAMT